MFAPLPLNEKSKLALQSSAPHSTYFLLFIMRLDRIAICTKPIIIRMKLQQLKEFCVIAQCENLTKAAKVLHTSQPSLSRNLRMLEEELNAELFTRTGRNIVLNDAGRFALERIAPALTNLDGVKRDIDKFVYDGSRSVDVFAPEPIPGLEEIIADFCGRYPDIKLRVSSQKIDRLKNTRPSIAIISSPIPREESNYLLLEEEPFSLMVSRDNYLAARKSVKLEQLSREPFVLPLQGALSETTTHMLQDAGITPSVVLEDNDRMRIMSYVAKGIGVTLAPAKTWIQGWEGKVAAIPLADSDAKRYLYLKWPEGSLMNWAAMKFRDCVVKHLNETCGFDDQA